MTIQNETLKGLLEQKGRIVEAGRLLNEELEKKGRVIVDKELLNKGVKISGDTYSGDYKTLSVAFSYPSMTAIQEIIKTDLKNDIEELESKKMMIMSLNDKVNEVITHDVIPTLELKEFDQITKVELINGEIELTVIDAVEEFKINFKKQNAK